LGESLTEGKGSFCGRTRRSSEVAAGLEREREEKKEEEEEMVLPNRYAPKSASLAGALLCPKGAS
jgi:hypothetical protein